MPPPAFLTRQLSNPSGLFGRLVMAPMLNRINAAHNALVLETLAPKAGEALLEIGFGGGALLSALLARRPERVTGVDVSLDMYQRAQRRFGRELSTGQLDLVHGDISALDPARTYDGIASVNSVYFWRDVPADLERLGDVLRPGGRLVLGIAAAEELTQQGLGEHGFTIVPESAWDSLCVQAGLRMTDMRFEPSAYGQIGVVTAEKIDA